MVLMKFVDSNRKWMQLFPRKDSQRVSSRGLDVNLCTERYKLRCAFGANVLNYLNLKAIRISPGKILA